MPDLFDTTPAPTGLQCVQNRPAARSADPGTSHAAARLAQVKHKDSKVAGNVLAVMRDGKPRIDEAIAEAVRANGHPLTDSRVRHGRKLLADLGVIVQTGQTRPTRANGYGREWQLQTRGTSAAPGGS